MYIIAPITVYDNDNQLWETKLGTTGINMPLLLSVWGKTAEESKQRAADLKRLLEVKKPSGL